MLDDTEEKNNLYNYADDHYLHKEEVKKYIYLYKISIYKTLFQIEDIKKQDVLKDKRMEAGQSKRIWDELYKVIDSSDVLAFIIDAR